MIAAIGIVSTQAHTTRPATLPSDRGKPTRCADSHNRPGYRMGCADGNTSPRCHEQCRRACSFGRESSDRFELGDFRAHRVNYSPAPGQRSESHGRVASEHYP